MIKPCGTKIPLWPSCSFKPSQSIGSANNKRPRRRVHDEADHGFMFKLWRDYDSTSWSLRHRFHTMYNGTVTDIEARTTFCRIGKFASGNLKLGGNCARH